MKWAGGKRWFVQRHADLLPKTFNRYIEPFLGGGSVFFYLQPSHSLLGDTNPDLIAAYLGIKQNWKGVVKSLQYHRRQHSDEHFYAIRGRSPKEGIPRASRMIDAWPAFEATCAKPVGFRFGSGVVLRCQRKRPFRRRIH